MKVLWRLALLISVAALAGAPAARAAERVYVTNFDANFVSVIDTANNNKVADIRTGRSPHGVAISPDGGRVYVSNEGDNNVSVIWVSAGDGHLA